MVAHKKYKGMKSTLKHIDNEEFLQEIVKSQNDGKATDRLWHLFQLLAAKIKHKSNFIGYPSDWVMEATMHCVSKLDRFDPNKSSNPFGYFTQAIHIHFIRLINDYKWEKANEWNYTCQHLLEQGVKSDKLHNIFAEPVFIDGVRYATTPEAVEALNISRETFRLLFVKGFIPYNYPCMEITRNGQTIRRAPDRYIVKANGQEPKSFKLLQDITDAFGISPERVNTWLHKGRIPAWHKKPNHTIQYITKTKTNTTIYSREYVDELMEEFPND